MNPAVVDTGTPPIPVAKSWLGRYGGDRGPAIDLSQAAPGEPPHPDLLGALARAAADPESARYGPILGDDALRSAFAADMRAAYGGDVAAADVAITAGCNLAFVATVLSVAGAGDDILLPVPWYFNHEMTARMLGIGVTPLPCEAAGGFVPDPAVAEGLIGPRTRAIVLVTPNNPTGAVYSPVLIAAFADLCVRRCLHLILDETYRDFLPAGQERAHDLFTRPDWRERLAHLYSFSKAYAVPGYRLGAIVAGPEVVPELRKVLDCFQICPSRVGQAGIAETMSGSSAWRTEARRLINGRAAAFEGAMQALPGWRIESMGAYFAYVRHPFGDQTGEAVAERLAVERGVLALPGSYFGPGQDRHLRFAFANAGESDLAGLARRLAP